MKRAEYNRALSELEGAADRVVERMHRAVSLLVDQPGNASLAEARLAVNDLAGVLDDLCALARAGVTWWGR